MDAPTIISTMKDSGAIYVSFKEGEQEDDYATFAVQEENCQDAVYNKKQSHKQIQTEMFTLSSAVKETHFWSSVSAIYMNIYQKTRRDTIALG